MMKFDGIRASLYKEALHEYPYAREEDILAMKKYLDPKSDEMILEVGAGSGFFSGVIADSVAQLIVSDPSHEQLDDVQLLEKENILIVESGADTLEIEGTVVDAIWSFGAMHHCMNKTKAFKNFARVLSKGGRVIIGDVWHGTLLAKHFDNKVAKYCITGHEVAFWTDEFAESLCFLTGFEKPKILDLPIQWKFKSKKDIGIFLYKIHAMTSCSPEECLIGAEEILGIKEKENMFYLNWPMKMLVTRKK